MVGVKRRQLYNLLEEGRASGDRERWILALQDILVDLSKAAGQDKRRVRAALLRPDITGTSLFDLTCRQDLDASRARAEQLADELRRGGLPGRVSAPSPSLKRRSNAEAASDFLSGYRDRDA